MPVGQWVFRRRAAGQITDCEDAPERRAKADPRAGGGMAMSKPTHATIRAYDVGFGDCFLLTFQYADDAKHLLIDFGSTRLPAGKTGKGNYLERIAAQIKADCGGKLTAVVATHRHKDHISGFS